MPPRSVTEAGTPLRTPPPRTARSPVRSTRAHPGALCPASDNIGGRAKAKKSAESAEGFLQRVQNLGLSALQQIPSMHQAMHQVREFGPALFGIITVIKPGVPLLQPEKIQTLLTSAFPIIISLSILNNRITSRPRDISKLLLSMSIATVGGYFTYSSLEGSLLRTAESAAVALAVTQGSKMASALSPLRQQVMGAFAGVIAAVGLAAFNNRAL